jgi:hypothetical protein
LQANSEAESTPPAAPASSRAALPFVLNGGWLYGVVALIVVAISLVLINLDLLPDGVLRWYPLGIVLPAIFWFLTALIRRHGKALLGAATLLGVGLSLLLNTQNVAAFSATFAGIILITVGVALVLHGLLLQNRPLA